MGEQAREDFSLRLAMLADETELERLIAVSARTLQEGFYSVRQIEGGSGHGVRGGHAADHGRHVATLPGEKLYATFGFVVVERYAIPLVNGERLPVVKMPRRY